jgi:hypothetical protein
LARQHHPLNAKHNSFPATTNATFADPLRTYPRAKEAFLSLLLFCIGVQGPPSLEIHFHGTFPSYANGDSQMEIFNQGLKIAL